MQVIDTVPNRGSVPAPSSMGGALAYPRPEAEKAHSADTAVSNALGADTRPGAIARSDDAPFIYAEINKLCTQFGRLEKEVELTTAEVRRQATTLHDVHVDTRNLCSKHDQTKQDITALGASLTQSIGSLITVAEGRINGQIGTLNTNLTTFGGDLSKATADVAQLRIEQAGVLTAVKVLTPVFKKTAWIFGSVISLLIVGAFSIAGLFWTQSMRPNLVKDISAEAHKTVLEVQRVKEVEAENARLKAENETLKRKR